MVGKLAVSSLQLAECTIPMEILNKNELPTASYLC